MFVSSEDAGHQRTSRRSARLDSGWSVEFAISSGEVTAYAKSSTVIQEEWCRSEL